MPTIKLCPSQKTIEVEKGQTILSALESAGYALKNNCRAGACGECKSKIISGEIDQGFVLDMALPQKEREEGYALTCMAKLVSDSIELEYAGADALPELFAPKENLRYLITDKTLVTPRVLRIKMRSLGSIMKFWPGQHIMLGDEQKNIPMRPYSIVNTPNENAPLQGRIPDLLPGLFPDLADYDLYIAGSNDFVDDCVAKAQELGAHKEHIHIERYL